MVSKICSYLELQLYGPKIYIIQEILPHSFTRIPVAPQSMCLHLIFHHLITLLMPRDQVLCRHSQCGAGAAVGVEPQGLTLTLVVKETVNLYLELLTISIVSE